MRYPVAVERTCAVGAHRVGAYPSRERQYSDTTRVVSPRGPPIYRIQGGPPDGLGPDDEIKFGAAPGEYAHRTEADLHRCRDVPGRVLYRRSHREEDAEHRGHRGADGA